ncbi:hypothetical protein KY339_06220, partial [Candidatus Woesearchaeota archaeon]|nr:hypothetical protein [Candidatus Woesearchaeota archaeon]
MAKTPEQEAEDLMRKYLGKLEKGLGEAGGISPPTKVTTVEYEEFKKEYMPKRFSIYEKFCQFSERIIKIRPDKKKLPEIQESIRICHLNVTPSGVASFAILGPVIFMLIGILLSYMLPVILGGSPSIFFMGFFVIAGLLLMGPLNGVPSFLANNWRMKASNQMVLCIFYVATYMRHTSNLENAIGFAAEHLAPPLSLDLKKVLWDVESGKFPSMKESLDIYLDSWKKWNMEFIESFHLLESSLYESAEDRRIGMLDKALSVILDETYEKMLHYAQNLKSPITMLHMLGVILPILGLVILPLIVSFMCGVKWYQLAMLYNVALPIGVFYLGKKILSTRPTGYGDTDISEENPELRKYRNIIFKLGKSELKINPLYLSVIIGVILLLIGLIPVMLHVVQPEGWDMILKKNVALGGSPVGTIMTYKDDNALYYFLGYRRAKGCEGEGVGDIIGPFGLGASLLSIFIPVSLAFGLGYYYRLRTKNVLKIRQEAKALEKEFASALFQLGNRLGDGLPVEIAFAKVSSTMGDTTSGSFFALVTQNIRRMGMSVEQAIFDREHGALLQYPSKLIESSM